MSHKIEVVKIKKPEHLNIIIGQTHFIKTVEDAIENIDIGGPSMLRSAAKNNESVTVFGFIVDSLFNTT